jgi:hypothetical protein
VKRLADAAARPVCPYLRETRVLIRPPSTTLAVHDRPPRRRARGILVGIGVVHRRSIGTDDYRRTCVVDARGCVTVLGVGSVAVYAGGRVAEHAGSPVAVDARSGVAGRARGSVAVDTCSVDPATLPGTTLRPADPNRDPFETDIGGSRRLEVACRAPERRRLRASRHQCQCAGTCGCCRPTFPGHDGSPIHEHGSMRNSTRANGGWSGALGKYGDEAMVDGDRERTSAREAWAVVVPRSIQNYPGVEGDEYAVRLRSSCHNLS